MDHQQMVIFTAVGDIMLADEVIIRRGSSKITRKYELTDPFIYTEKILRDSHITFGNLECPLCNYGEPICDKDVVVKGKPEYVQYLRAAGFNIVSIANNHIMDYGAEGLFDTKEILSKNGIKSIGADRNISEARKSIWFEIDGLKICFLAYYGATGADKYTAGTASGKLLYVKNDLSQVRGLSDFVIISFHWGIEYANTPPATYVKFARKLIDEGANIILGHHPHVLQGIEQYHNGVIAYSLGNFVFDISIHPVNIQETRQSVILKCNLTRNGVEEVKLIPVYINDIGQPEILQDREKEKIMIRIQKLSSNLNISRLLKESENQFIHSGLFYLRNKGFCFSLKYLLRNFYHYSPMFLFKSLKQFILNMKYRKEL